MTYEEPPRWLPPMADPPPPAPPKPPPQVPLWAPFLALLAVVFLASTFGAAVIALAAASDPDIKVGDPPVTIVLGLTAVQNLGFVLAAWLAVRLTLGRTPPEVFGFVRVRSFWGAVGWAAATFAGFWTVIIVLRLIFGETTDQQLVTDVREEDRLAIVLAYSVLLCLIAPFVEELFFRGFMFGTLKDRMNPVLAAVIVGVVFGVGHAVGAPIESVIALCAFGVGLCLLYWRTQSIIPGMALHALNNSITFGAVRELDPAPFVAVVVVSVAVVTGAALALSPRATVTA